MSAEEIKQVLHVGQLGVGGLSGGFAGYGGESPSFKTDEEDVRDRVAMGKAPVALPSGT